MAAAASRLLLPLITGQRAVIRTEPLCAVTAGRDGFFGGEWENGQLKHLWAFQPQLETRTVASLLIKSNGALEVKAVPAYCNQSSPAKS